VELQWGEGAGLLSVLIEGIEPSVEAQAEMASYLLRGFGELTDEYPDSIAPPGGEVVVKISAPPAELTGVLDSTLEACSRRGVTPSITGHAGIGVTYAALSGGGEEAQAQIVEELREIWSRRGGSVVVRDAPPAFKKKVEVWGPLGSRLELTRRVKQKFDPRGILNPGRFAGGI
jgi:glycolate oxidase FAD binding subunit